MDDLSLLITITPLILGVITIGFLILKSIYKTIWVKLYNPELKKGYLLNSHTGEIFCFLSKISLINHFDLNRVGYGEDIVDRIIVALDVDNLDYVNEVLNELFEEAIREVFIVE